MNPGFSVSGILAISFDCQLNTGIDTINCDEDIALLKLSFAACVTVMMTLALQTQSASAQSSSFQRSCVNVYMEVDQFGTPVMAADCYVSGASTAALNFSTLPINGIENRFGVLTQVGGFSTFQNSCGDYQLDVRQDSVWLGAWCGNGRGEDLFTWIEVMDIHNQSGWLNN